MSVIAISPVASPDRVRACLSRSFFAMIKEFLLLFLLPPHGRRKKPLIFLRKSSLPPSAPRSSLLSPLPPSLPHSCLLSKMDVAGERTVDAGAEEAVDSMGAEEA